MIRYSTQVKRVSKSHAQRPGLPTGSYSGCRALAFTHLGSGLMAKTAISRGSPSQGLKPASLLRRLSLMGIDVVSGPEVATPRGCPLRLGQRPRREPLQQRGPASYAVPDQRNVAGPLAPSLPLSSPGPSSVTSVVHLRSTYMVPTYYLRLDTNVIRRYLRRYYEMYCGGNRWRHWGGCAILPGITKNRILKGPRLTTSDLPPSECRYASGAKRPDYWPALDAWALINPKNV